MNKKKGENVYQYCIPLQPKFKQYYEFLYSLPCLKELSKVNVWKNDMNNRLQ